MEGKDFFVRILDWEHESRQRRGGREGGGEAWKLQSTAYSHRLRPLGGVKSAFFKQKKKGKGLEREKLEKGGK